MFGSNVGDSRHYRKQAVMDANGQLTVTYADQEGRTIATALAGDAPSNVSALASLSSGDWGEITEDISSKVVISGNERVHTHKVLNVGLNTRYTFSYDLSGQGDDSSAFGCIGCSYDLELSITSPSGSLVQFPAVPGNASSDSYHYRLYDIAAQDCALSDTLSSIEFDLVFGEVGSYTFTKRLIAREVSLSRLESIVANDAQVQIELEGLRNWYPLDPSSCEFCSDCDVETEIENTIREVSEQNCEGIYGRIVEELRLLHSDDPGVYVPTSAEIEGHALYCQYTYCKKNVSSDQFEMRLSRIRRLA